LKRPGVLSALAVLTLFVAGTSQAQTTTWTGATSTFWSDDTNWTNNKPDIGTDVFFPNSTSAVDASFFVGTLTTTGTGTAFINLSGNHILTIENGITQSGATLNVSASVTCFQEQPWSFTGTNRFSGPVSGAGFDMTGGTLILSGNNNFLAASVISGTLQATTATALGTGTITLTGGNLSLAGATALAFPASVEADANGTLSMSATGYSVANLTVLSGVALSVTGGVLKVPGTLSGAGSVTGTVAIPANGNVTPGTGGTGTLTVGTLTLASTSNLNYSVGATTTLLSVGTALTVNGIVNVLGSTPPPAGTYSIIQGAPLTAGTLTLGTVPSGASYGLSVSGTGTAMLLTVGPAPTAVGLAAGDAVSDGHASYITWKTGFETKNLGYRVYRQDGAVRTLLMPGLIAGSALRATAALKLGHTYAWKDTTSAKGGTYWIESVDMGGRTEMFGPLTAHAGAAPKSLPSPLLSDASRTSALLLPGAPMAHVRGETLQKIPVNLAQQWLNAANTAAKVLVRASGVYRVPAEQLFAAGIPAGVEVSDIRLWTNGVPATFQATTADGVHLQPGDALEFYGQGIDTRYSDTGVYWVTVGTGPQQLLGRDSSTGSSAGDESFPEMLEVRQQLYYFSAVKNGGAEKFFGPQVPSTGLIRTFSTPALDVLSTSPAALEVAVQGLSDGAHAIDVALNGVLLGTLTGVDRALMVKTLSVPAAQLIAGDNTVLLTARGAADIDVESYQRLSYPRRYTKFGGPLSFTGGAGSLVYLEGFVASATRVFDVTVPETAVELTVSADPASPSNAFVTIPSSSGTHTLYAFAASDELTPLGVQSNVGSEWHASGGAELVIIGPASLLPATQPLVQQRQREGLTVATVDVQDVYDEFSYGEKDASAIRSFLQYAAQNWAVSPRYVLLVGGATYDPRDYLNNPGLDLVPTNLIETVFLETGSDGAFVDFPVSKGAGMAIGRWPVTSAADTALVVAKTLDRVPLKATSQLLLVNDRDDTTSFSQASAEVRATVAAWPVQQIARGSDDSSVHDAVVAAMRSGPAAVDYQGHGAEDFWDGNILSDTDSDALANAGQSLLFSAATCFNGYFVDIGRTSLAQSLLLTEGGGAWAAWASSGMTSPAEHSHLSSDLLQAAVVDGLTLGDASVRAKSTIQDADVRSTFHLFGDPSARMAPARGGALNAPPAVQTGVASGCGTPGNAVPATLPFVALALLLGSKTRRRTLLGAHGACAPGSLRSRRS
jgi:hypothetical protein